MIIGPLWFSGVYFLCKSVHAFKVLFVCLFVCVELKFAKLTAFKLNFRVWSDRNHSYDVIMCCNCLC